MEWIDNYLDGVQTGKEAYKWERVGNLDKHEDSRWDLYIAISSGQLPTKKWLSIEKTHTGENKETICYKVVARTRFEKGDLITLTSTTKQKQNEPSDPNDETIGLGGEWIRRVSGEDVNYNPKTVNALITCNGAAIRAVRRITPGCEIICTPLDTKCNSWWDVTWLDMLIWDNNCCFGRRKHIGRITSYSKSSHTFSVRFENGSVKSMGLDEIKEKAFTLEKNEENGSNTQNHIVLFPSNPRKRTRSSKNSEV